MMDYELNIDFDKVLSNFDHSSPINEAHSQDKSTILSQQSYSLVHCQFHSVLLKYAREHHPAGWPWKAIKKFEKLCEEAALQLAICGMRSDGGTENVQQSLQLLKVEKFTWSLMLFLFERQLAPALDKSFSSTPVECLSDVQIWYWAWTKSEPFRKICALQIFLEHWAMDKLNDPDVFIGDPDKYFWEEALLNELHARPQVGRSALELDIDAPFRMDRLIKCDDEVRQNVIFKAAYQRLRRGNLKDAIDFCQKSGATWLGAIFASALKRDQVFCSIMEHTFAPAQFRPYHWRSEGEYRAWRALCHGVAERETSSFTAERAIYGWLSGNFKALLPCCLAWEDQLWAQALSCRRDLMCRVVDLFRRRGAQAALEWLNNESTSRWSSMFEYMSSNFDYSKEEVSSYVYREIINCLATKSYNALVYVLETCAEHCEISDPYSAKTFRRFLCHVNILLHAIQRDEQTLRAFDFASDVSLATALKLSTYYKLIENYVGLLASERDYSLLPHYATYLAEDKRTSYISHFLQGDHSGESRLYCIEVAESAGLSVPDICKAVVSNCIDSLLPVGQKSIKNVDKVVLEVIRYLNILLRRNDLYVEAVRQICKIARRLLICKETESAGEMLTMIDPPTLDNDDGKEEEEENDQLDPTMRGSFQEYYYLTNCVRAFRGFVNWFDHVCSYVNYADDGGRENLIKLHRLPYDRLDSLCATGADGAQSEVAYKEWLRNNDTYYKRADVALTEFLSFSGDLALDKSSNDQWEATRKSELQALREMYIPFYVEMLLFIYRAKEEEGKVFSICAMLTKAVSLKHEWYVRPALDKFLNRVIESALINLHNQLDAFGCEQS